MLAYKVSTYHTYPYCIHYHRPTSQCTTYDHKIAYLVPVLWSVNTTKHSITIKLVKFHLLYTEHQMSSVHGTIYCQSRQVSYGSTCNCEQWHGWTAMSHTHWQSQWTVKSSTMQFVLPNPGYVTGSPVSIHHALTTLAMHHPETARSASTYWLLTNFCSLEIVYSSCKHI